MFRLQKRIASWMGRLPALPARRRVTLYSKPDCHLCEEAHDALMRVRQDTPFDLESIDITTDPALLERYRARIPVVLIDGTERFWYRINERRLRRELRERRL